MTTHRNLRRVAIGSAVVAMVVAACGGGASPSPSAAPAGYEEWVPDPALLAEAKKEGKLTTIALPHSWCNYGESISVFKARTGLAVNELNPDAGSGDEIEAIKANQGSTGDSAPDVIDVGLAFGPSAKADGLIQPYKVSTWDSIPDSAKDAEGYWYGDYYGVLAFEVNKSVVKNTPADWADLLKDEYKNQVALPGDPRASNQAIQAVYAAGLANGGSLDNAQAGLDFFKQLNDKGNFVPTIAQAGTIDAGATPVTVRWTYNALVHRDEAAGTTEIDVVVPKSGRFAGVYVQAISAYAPHPNAAQLWMEFLYSDEGQNVWLNGYCHPIRYENLVENNLVPAAQLAKLPDVTGAVFPTLDQLNAAKKLITEGWDGTVGADVK